MTPFPEFAKGAVSRLMKAAADGVPAAGEEVLADIGWRYGLDRVVLYRLAAKSTVIRRQLAWCRDPVDEVGDIVADEAPWLLQQAHNREITTLNSKNDFPAEAIADYAYLESQRIHAACLLPLDLDSETRGVVMLASRKHHDWTGDLLTEVATIATMVAGSIWAVRQQTRLQAEQSMFRAVVEDQSEFVLRWLPDGTITWINDSFCDYLGKSREELVGTRDTWVLSKEASDELLKQIHSLTPTAPTMTKEYHLGVGTEREYWQEWTDRGIFDADGSLVTIQSVGRDITDRKLADYALEGSERRFRELVESTNDVVWEMDDRLQPIYSNRRFEKLLGYTQHELLDLGVAGLMNPSDFEALEAKLPQLMAERRGWQRRLFRFRHKDGSYRYLESSATPIIDEQGNVVGFRGVDRDVTGEYVATEEVRSAEAMVRLLFNQLNDAVFAIDGDVYVDCNPSAVEIMAATQEEIVGRHPWDFAPEYQPDGTRSEVLGREMLGRARAGESLRFDWLHKSQDGAARYTEVSLFTVRSRTGPIIYAVVYDKTELTLANERLVHSADFQQHKADLLMDLTTMVRNTSEPVINRSLKRIGEIYGAERITLWLFSEDRRQLERLYFWVADAASDFVLPQTLVVSDVAWAAERLFAGESIVLRAIDDLPDEAGTFKKIMKTVRAESALLAPLVEDGATFGVCSYSASTADIWDALQLEELEVLTNTLASALSRFRATESLTQREGDLNRSQRAGGVGSYKVAIRLKEGDEFDVVSEWVSEEAYRIFGLDRQASYDEFRERLHEDDRESSRQLWLETIQGVSSGEIECRIVRTDGTVRHTREKVAVDRGDKPDEFTIFGVFNDVTDWVEANNQLRGALAEIETLKDQLQEENIYLREEVRAAQGFDRIIGQSEALRKVLAAAEQVAPTDVAVLITGETGTGKELVAQSIHDLSHRKDKPIVSVNCAALSPELIESELFGHEKGAFTGAHARRVGRFELANGGTLFLDEIGEMPGDLQAKLLRVLQEGEYERLGGSETLKTDIRLIAATNRDLRHEVDKGNFRADLYYRIASFPIHMPPLRERTGDISLLAEHFVRKHAAPMNKDIDAISARTLRYLRDRPWPGNIRELEATIQRALITSPGSVLDYAGAGTTGARDTTDSAVARTSSIHDIQRTHIVETLENKRWVIEGRNGAAGALGVPPSTLRSTMKRLNISRPKQATAEIDDGQ